VNLLLRLRRPPGRSAPCPPAGETSATIRFPSEPVPRQGGVMARFVICTNCGVTVDPELLALVEACRGSRLPPGTGILRSAPQRRMAWS
jgi:hypothetical protein